MSESRSSIMKQNLLFPIQLEDENNEGKYVNNILQKTKSLVLSNQNYNKFMKKYLILTQQSSFKLPEITNYPILKNEYLIPIIRQTYSSECQFITKTKNVNNKENLILNDIENNRLKSAGFSTIILDKNSNNVFPQIIESNLSSNPLLPINNELNLDNNHLNVENYLISKRNDTKNNTINTIDYNKNENSNNTKTKNLGNKKLTSENEMKIISIIRSQTSFTNKLFDKKFTLRSASDIDLTKDYSNRNVYVSNDYKTLILDLLVDFEINNKIFNYEEMIKNKYCLKSNTDEIKKTKILDRMKSLINNLIVGKNENLTSELKKTYEIQDNKIIELKISSLELEFVPLNPIYNTINSHKSSNYFNCDSRKDFVFDSHKNNNSKNNEDHKTQTIKIPFSLIPIFYYCKIETFYTIIAKIILVSENFYKSKKAVDNYFNEEIKEILEDGTTIENNNYESIPNREDQISIIDFETVRKVLESHKDFIFENENYNKEISCLKTLEWISKSKHLTIQIHPPKIEFYLADKTFNISKNVPKEMLLFLINKSFINWDFFVLNYLSKFKLFRDNLNERFYKKIKQPKLKSLRNTQGNFNTERSLVMNDFANQPLVLSLDEKINEPDAKILNSIHFFFTNCNGETNFFLLNSYELNIFLRSQEHIKTVKNQCIEENVKIETKEFKFKFSMNQLIKLQKLKKFYDIKDYLKRMVAIQKKNSNNNGYTKIVKLKNENLEKIKVDFDLKYFENLDENFFKYLTKTNQVKNITSEEEGISTLNNEEKEENSINYELR